MLRSEHVMARMARGRLVPHRIPPDDARALEAAAELCELYATHVGDSRASLEEKITPTEEALGPRLDARRGFKTIRALAKLLEERCEWSAPTASDPYTVRTRIFELAAALPELPAVEPSLLETVTRDDLISQVAREIGSDDPVSLMYADRQGAQVLSVFEKPTPEDLIARYNVAQVQGVLYAARELVVDLREGCDARLVLHYVKKLGLIYALEETNRGYRLRLDGPLSVFGGTRKYGLRLAKLLPGLLLTAPWSLSATVEWKGRDATLNLDSDAGLESHYRGPKDDGETNEVREAFIKAWARAKKTNGWKLEERRDILPLPELKTALVPDFVLTKGGERVYLELLGFWNERRLIERVELVREAARRGHHVLVAASENLGASRETLAEAAHGEVIPFKNRLEVKAVLAAL
jgi:predicted nuclease of restriction endonuclease-like RecB superfamily